MNIIYDSTRLIGVLEAGGVVWGARQRLCRAMMGVYDDHQRQQKRHAWQTPFISTAEQWLRSQWTSLVCVESAKASPWYILSDEGEQILWQQAIAQNCDEHSFDTVNHMRQAYKQLLLWQIDWDEELVMQEFQRRDNGELFYKCLQSYRILANEKKAMTCLEIAPMVIEMYRTGQKKKVPIIAPIGFQPFPPLYRELAAFIGEKNEDIAVSELTAESELIQCTDSLSELYSAARWAREKSAAHPEKTYAVVVPNLTQQRPIVERVLTDVFAGDCLLNPDISAVVNIAAPRSLTHFSLVSTALHLLDLPYRPIQVSLLCALLQSPYITECSAPGNTARPIKELLKRRQEEMTPDDLYQWCDESTLGETCPQMVRALKEMKKDKPTLCAPSAWVDQWRQELRALGYPGRGRFNHAEYQQWERWQDLLNEFALYDALLGQLNRPQATQRLNDMAWRCQFQAQSVPTVTVHVLGALEIAGLRCDGVWYTGWNTNWPVFPHPNPMIPLSLQKEWGMNYADVAHNADMATQLFADYQQSAPHILWSMAQSADDCEMLPHNLVSGYKPNAEWEHTWQPHWVMDPADAPQLEPVVLDDVRVESPVMRSGHFTDQYACPFRAFALHRLGARQIDETAIGPDYAERGQLVHEVLAELYKQATETGNMSYLFGRDSRKSLIADSCDRILEKWQKENKAVQRWGEIWLSLERERLVNLISQWMETAESQRSQREKFKVVECESTIKGKIGDAEVNLRIDRLDRTHKGDYWLIDYKTGKKIDTKWDYKRLSAPQMPLYALVYTQDKKRKLHTLAVAQVCSSESKYKYHTQEITPSLLKEWRVAIECLADEYCRGVARVAPQKESTCRYCHLHHCCRIREQEKI